MVVGRQIIKFASFFLRAFDFWLCHHYLQSLVETGCECAQTFVFIDVLHFILFFTSTICSLWLSGSRTVASDDRSTTLCRSLINLISWIFTSFYFAFWDHLAPRLLSHPQLCSCSWTIFIFLFKSSWRPNITLLLDDGFDHVSTLSDSILFQVVIFDCTFSYFWMFGSRPKMSFLVCISIFFLFQFTVSSLVWLVLIVFQHVS